MPTDAVIVFATFQTRDEAEQVGEALVEKGMAACGSVVPTVHSFYRWEGRLHREHEALLLLKTSRQRVEDVQAFIQREGTYRIPEILAVGVETGLPSYLEWLMGEVGERG